MVPVQVALADAARALGDLAALDPSASSDAALVEATEALLALESRLRFVQARWLRALDVRDATVAECGRATRSWLIEEQRLGPAEATRRMALARRLDSAPAVAAVFGAGDVTADHASVVCDALDAVGDDQLRPVVESALVDLARVEPPFVVARALDQVLAMLGVESDADAAYARRHEQRHVSLVSTFGGTGSLAGTLTPEGYEVLRVALDAASAAADPDDERTSAQRRHDGLVDIARHYVQNADVPDVAGERPRVVVTMSLDTLRGDGGWAAVESGVAVAPNVARRLACDAEVIPAVLGSRGEVLDFGRATRVFSAAIRRAAKLRDGGRCAYPKCSRQIAELHHIVPWSQGGPTRLDNAAWLCTFHHWLVHDGGWAMARGPDGGYDWSRRRTVPVQREVPTLIRGKRSFEPRRCRVPSSFDQRVGTAEVGWPDIERAQRRHDAQRDLVLQHADVFDEATLDCDGDRMQRHG